MIKQRGASRRRWHRTSSRGLTPLVSQLVWVQSLSRKVSSYNANSSLLTIEWE